MLGLSQLKLRSLRGRKRPQQRQPVLYILRHQRRPPRVRGFTVTLPVPVHRQRPTHLRPEPPEPDIPAHERRVELRRVVGVRCEHRDRDLRLGLHAPHAAVAAERDLAADLQPLLPVLRQAVQHQFERGPVAHMHLDHTPDLRVRHADPLERRTVRPRLLHRPQQDLDRVGPRQVMQGLARVVRAHDTRQLPRQVLVEAERPRDILRAVDRRADAGVQPHDRHPELADRGLAFRHESNSLHRQPSESRHLHQY